MHQQHYVSSLFIVQCQTAVQRTASWEHLLSSSVWLLDSLSPLAGTSLYEDQSSPLLSAGGLRLGPLSITVVPVPDPKTVRTFLKIR